MATETGRLMGVRGKRLELLGQRFGCLVVLSRAANGKGRYRRWLCRCDCGKETIVKGSSLYTGHTQSCGCEHGPARIPMAERFWAKVNKDGPMPSVCSAGFGNCWLWTGFRLKKGYGRFTIEEGSTALATHVSWFLEYGVWTAMHLLHVCDNPPCIRPSHLFEGPDANNKYDRILKSQGAILIDTPLGPID